MMEINQLKQRLNGREIAGQLEILSGVFGEEVLFTTSFGIEDQVITHIIFTEDLPVRIATLDTGRLFPETYSVFNETIKKYKKPISVYFPDHAAVEKMMVDKGPFSFYHSKENRIECCHIRKVVPLSRALKGMKVWISGIRADQSDNRNSMDWLEYDSEKDLYKFYPLFSWTYEEVNNYIRQNQIPYNVLHDRGFASIGCQPCTRAIQPGENFRAGRWWWETDGTKECGCHVKKS